MPTVRKLEIALVGNICLTSFLIANHPYIFENADIVILLKLIPDLYRGERPKYSQSQALASVPKTNESFQTRCFEAVFFS